MNKKVLITGADGFIGSHLTEMLLEKGYKVKALAYYNSFNFRGWLEGLKNYENLEVTQGDIRDPHFCKNITKGVDLIFHLAALIAIPYSYTAPDAYVDTNIKGTLNICQAARENGNIRIIHTSTSEVYGTAKYVPINESHPKQPQSPYSASKIGADAIAMSFYYSFDLPVTIVRPFNTYGPRQSARAIIPAIITQLLSGQKEIKLGALSPTRDFNYVKDTCSGFTAIADSSKTIGEEINIASRQEISMGDLSKEIIRQINPVAKVIHDEQRIRPEKSEVNQLLGENEKIKKITDWNPRFSFAEGIAETIKWFRDKQNLSRYKTDIYNI